MRHDDDRTTATGIMPVMLKRGKHLLALIALPAALAACGGSSKEAATINATCGDGTSLVGVISIKVEPVAGKGTVLSFPDPANAGKTGTIVVTEGRACTITGKP
jgi:hypothetical protein